MLNSSTRNPMRFATLSLLALSAFAQSCACDEVYINRVQRNLQVSLDPDEVQETLICKDDEGNEFAARECSVDFGEIGINYQSLRTIHLANIGTPNIEVYRAEVTGDSPLFDQIELLGDSVDATENPVVLQNGQATAVRVLVDPQVEWEAGDWIGNLHIYTNAENTDVALLDEECLAANVPAPCARTEIALSAWPRDLGNVEIVVVAEVGSDIFETGICNFGAVGIPDEQSGAEGGEGRCKLRVRNNGDRDAMVTSLALVIPQDERSECGSSCSFGTYCTAASSCTDGPFSSFWEANNSGYSLGDECDSDSPCALGEFCAFDADSATSYCSVEAPASAQPIFRLQREVDVSDANPLVIESGREVVVTILFKPGSLAKYAGAIRFKGNLPTPGGVLHRPMLGIGHNAPVARPEVKTIDGSANFRRNDDGDPQAAPLSTVTITGENSTGLGGARITDYEWSLDERYGASIPEGSGVRLRSDSNMETDLIYGTNTPGLDSAGVYNVALRVKDERGVWSSWAVLAIDSKPDSAIHVELTWDHPTADVDLHLLRAGEPTNYGGDQDCYYLNCNTARNSGRPRLSWGPDGEADDPRLDLDDVNGFGPENINIVEPEVPQDYLIGVYYYRADGGGAQRATVATIRVYIGGRLEYEESALLEDTQAWWEPAIIMWGEANPILARRRLEPRPPN
jgi:hypothetical protein